MTNELVEYLTVAAVIGRARRVKGGWANQVADTIRRDTSELVDVLVKEGRAARSVWEGVPYFILTRPPEPKPASEEELLLREECQRLEGVLREWGAMLLASGRLTIDNVREAFGLAPQP